MSNKLQLRRDTAANWETANPVLAQGEIGLILDSNGKVVGQKIGNGVTEWNKLDDRISVIETMKKAIGLPATTNVTVTKNRPVDAIVDCKASAQDKVTIHLSSAGGFWSNDVLGNLYIIDENDTKIEIAKSIEYTNFTKEITIPVNIKAINLYRSATSLGDGNIQVSYAVEHFVTKNEIVSKIGNEIREEISIVEGEQLLNTIPFVVEQGKTFRITGNIPRGLYSNNAYNLYAFTDVTCKNGYTLFSGSLPKNLDVSYTAEQKIYGIQINRGNPALSSGTIVINIENFRFLKNEEYEASTKGLVYVDAVNGSDDNDGTSSNPLATFSKAISMTGADTTIILVGDTSEVLNIKSKPNQQFLTVIGAQGVKNRILGGTRITAATQYQGDVYYIDRESFPSGDNFYLFQHEIPDVNTLISDEERHPLQRGREYRCESTIIRRTTSVQDVIDSQELSYFWDSENTKLYFKIANGSNLVENPVIIPGNTGVYGNDGSVKVTFVNLDTWYCNFNLSKCHGAILRNCAAKYAYSAGCFVWDNAIGITLDRCEAARAFTGSATGDGFNAHSTQSDDAEARHTTCTMIDCWSHDNNDDGYSDHERCECAIHGGLFEYNKKAGITPSYGSHLVCHNVLSRRNYSGFSYVGPISETEGGIYGQMVCYNCVSENNHPNVGFGVSGSNNSGILVSCKSFGNPIGYAAYSSTKLTLIDCSSSGDTEIKSALGGTITVKNTTLVD